MIFGECPYCDGPLTLPLTRTVPSFQKHQCESCKKTIWTYHSRFEPQSYTEEAFLEKYNVDEETKKITDKVTL